MKDRKNNGTGIHIKAKANVYISCWFYSIFEEINHAKVAPTATLKVIDLLKIVTVLAKENSPNLNWIDVLVITV